VVRATAASAIPLIAAVGHETDTTLIDHAADKRAPTPTAAAEMAVPVRLDLVAETQALSGRLAAAMTRRLAQSKLQLDGLGRGLPDPAALIETAQQRLDDRSERLELGLRQWLAIRAQRLSALAQRWRGRAPGAELARLAKRLDELSQRARAAMPRQLAHQQHRLDNLGGRLDTIYQALRDPLTRGYAMVRTARNKVVTNAGAVNPDASLILEFDDGTVRVRAEGGKQGRLF
jgi:exodeoxyribonuclease VII large subunit